jgi:hypothetical protein
MKIKKYGWIYKKGYPDYFEGGYGMHHGMGYGMMGYGG